MASYRGALLFRKRSFPSCADFEGVPVMLNDGQILDSARLPQGALEGHIVEVSAESLMQSMRSGPGSAQGHPITFSGGSIMDSGASSQSFPTHPQIGQPSRALDRTLLSEQNTSSSAQKQFVEYHPVTVLDEDQLQSGALEGENMSLCFC